MEVFMPVRFRTQVQLSPNSITTGNIDDHVHEKIKKSLEGICSRFGYIRPGSIEIVKRSMGCLMKAHFNGHIKYDIVCKADVCNPVRGMVFKAIVKNKNELGILAEGAIILDGTKLSVLDVLIPRRSAGITSEIDLDTVDVGDEVFAEVLGKRYQLNDKKISVIARAVKDTKIKQKRSDKEKMLTEYDVNGLLIKEEEYADIPEGIDGGDDEIDGGSEHSDEEKVGGEEEDEDDDDDESEGGMSDIDEEQEGGDDGEIDGGGIINEDDF
jgi:hypothetical protein